MDDLRPFDRVEQHGPPADPIPFPGPQFFRGRRDDVMCYDPATDTHEVKRDVLFRDFRVRDEDDDDRALGAVQRAYWALPFKNIIRTIMGHVQICVVLTRDIPECGSDSENEDEGVPDIVFQMTQEYVAIKVNYSTRMDRMRGRHAEDPLQEIAAMQIIGNQHPNVLGCIEVLFDGQNLNVVLPYLSGGDLFQVMQERHGLAAASMPEGLARYWVRQLCSGLRHLHSVGICHRDLSPENVMLSSDRACVIIDMGMSLRMPYGHPKDPDFVTDITNGTQRRLIRPQGACGKLPYMSPEIYLNRVPFDGEAVDVWTVGTILFCLLTGNRSYQRAHKTDSQFYWMTHGLRTLLADWGVVLSDEAISLLQGMLEIEPRMRLTLEEVVAHPWFALPDMEPE